MVASIAHLHGILKLRADRSFSCAARGITGNPGAVIRRASLALAILLLSSVLPCSLQAETTHRVYFKSTDSELDVYHIRGRLPGPTLLLVGGIQGNEPGGYLAADLYADISLKKGNMIVVPRANFLSIVKNSRGVRGDMNRKFAGRPGKPDQDWRVVDIIKRLMKKTDFFLNLHDGSGFYYPTWESPTRNPMRFGQSIIADAEVYARRDGKVLELGRMAQRVAAKVNPQIADESHSFRFNNHNTRALNTRHKEQRLSATYHALTSAGIPAFGIETSKSIPDYGLRVRYQTMVISAFLDEFGIIPDNPKIYLENPSLKYLIVSINGRTPIVVTGHDVLKVHKGDRLRIVHIESNYSRGLTAQLKGSERRFNCLNREMALADDALIQVRKDRFLIATIPVEIIRKRTGRSEAGVHFEPRVGYFCVRVNDTSYMIEPGEELSVVRGDKLVILDPKTNLDRERDKAMRVDLRGFQAESSPYPVEDRGHIISTEKDLRPKYGLHRGSQTLFSLEAKLNNRVFGRCYIAVAEPRIDYFILRGSRGGSFVVRDGDRLEVPADEVIRIMDVRTNVSETAPLFVTMAGRTIRMQRGGSAGIDASKLPGREIPLHITREGRSLGRIWIKRGKEYRLSSGKNTPHAPLIPARFPGATN